MNTYQQYPTTRQTYNYMQPNARIRPVSSIEEVRAAAIDFDGSVFYFPDFANKRIYTKQINLDGTASLNMYELVDLPTESTTYVTKEEFNTTLVEIKDYLAKLNTSPKEEKIPTELKF